MPSFEQPATPGATNLDPVMNNEQNTPEPTTPNQPEPAPTSESRPPTPNWTGFTPQPDFQQAREHDRQLFEEEGARNNYSYFRHWNRVPEVPMKP